MSRGWLERNQGRPPREVGGRWAPSQADVRLFFSFLRSIDDLYPPRLSISSSYDLEHILPQLGMKQVFINQADLSGVTGAENLAVTQVSL